MVGLSNDSGGSVKTETNIIRIYIKLTLFVVLVILVQQMKSQPEVQKVTHHENVAPVAQVTKPAPKKEAAPTKVERPIEETSSKQPIIAVATDGPDAWMEAAGIAHSDRQYVKSIMGQESSWILDRVNSIGCIGLGQACPSGNKAEMLSRCPDWQTNGVCQMKVWVDYMQRRYGSWSYANEWKFCTQICNNAHTGATVNKHGEPWW